MYRLISAAYALPLDVLAIAGLFCSRRFSRLAKGLLLTPAVYFTVVHALSVGSLRYRVPVEPMLAALAAAGVLAVLSLFSGGAQHRGFVSSNTQEVTHGNPRV
jgi:hypothetical protein